MNRHILVPLLVALLGCPGPGTGGKTPVAVEDADGDGLSTADGDCDDGDPDIGPEVTEACNGLDDDCDGDIDEALTVTGYADLDADGFGDPAAPHVACELAVGDAVNADDCDDTRVDVYPGAAEVCDGVDQDCDGDVDEGVGEAWYADADGDGHGDPTTAFVACTPPDSGTAVGDDCDDSEPAVFPGNPEVCDGLDNDCDGSVDAGVTTTFWADADGDGWGDDDAPVEACALAAGLAAAPGDCDDAEPAVSPSATELCNGRDDDCDGAVDEADAADALPWYADDDGDGFGDSATGATGCDAPVGFVADSSDCDDTDAAVNPAAEEVCDGRDDDCDGGVDEAGAVDASTWYADADGDGFGDPAASSLACSAPAGSVADATDCDDADATVNPAATEVCNGHDDDCDTLVDGADSSSAGGATWYADADADGYGDPGTSTVGCAAPAGYVADATDCDDLDPAVSPAAAEVCNGLDDDCDALMDDADPGVTGAPTWYFDGDGDGYGDAGSPEALCTATADVVATSTDCDDGDAAVHPGATEICNGVDDDCDTLVDDADPGVSGTTAWYADTDGDGYGDPTALTTACSAPADAVANAGDCDDGEPLAWTGAPETCDGVDNDCDGTVDNSTTDYCCSGSGLIWTIPDGCINDGGGSAGGDALQVYCFNGSARFCLSGESCQWRAGLPAVDDGTTCERSGLSSDYMANGWCSLYDGYANYACTSAEKAYLY